VKRIASDKPVFAIAPGSRIHHCAYSVSPMVTAFGVQVGAAEVERERA
jgi:hypothetical protein